MPEAHLARYVVDVVEGLELSELERAYAGRGSEAYHPATLLSLLIYGYTTGTFSSRKIERATYDSLAFRYITSNRHPDHDTLATFRKCFGKEFQSAFVQVLQVARENQLSRIGTVSLDGTKIEARAKERYEQGQAEYAAKMAARAESVATTGKKPGGKPPVPPESGPRADDQINLTDEESRIMKVAGGGFEQCYNAPAVVDTESMLILAAHVTQATNDKEQVEPMVAKMQANPAGLNQPGTLLADTGYFSQRNVEACSEAKITPLIAVKREAHHPAWRERFTEPALLAEGSSPVDAMKHALKTKSGRATYALRKKTVEPVFGIIKSVMESAIKLSFAPLKFG